MDIAAISGALPTTAATNYKKEEAVTKSFTDALSLAQKNSDDAELMNACTEFESYFLSVMYKQMQKTTSFGSSLTEKSQAEQIFQDMLDDEMTKSSAASGGVGLAHFMYKQIKREQAGVYNVTPYTMRNINGDTDVTENGDPLIKE